MSARHTRTGHIANDLHKGTLFVTGLEPYWFANIGTTGRHRSVMSERLLFQRRGQTPFAS
jgi:hypothetical protein